MLWEMIVSNVTCMKIEYIRLKHAKWYFKQISSLYKLILIAYWNELPGRKAKQI
ncbi:hypothetical protein LDENG_00256030 [Lucifuga dentata]|nr:hypothetical protein LDENG_00256030 [Lucifuga dentata]